MQDARPRSVADLLVKTHIFAARSYRERYPLNGSFDLPCKSPFDLRGLCSMQYMPGISCGSVVTITAMQSPLLPHFLTNMRIGLDDNQNVQIDDACDDSCPAGLGEPARGPVPRGPGQSAQMPGGPSFNSVPPPGSFKNAAPAAATPQQAAQQFSFNRVPPPHSTQGQVQSTVPIAQSGPSQAQNGYQAEASTTRQAGGLSISQQQPPDLAQKPPGSSCPCAWRFTTANDDGVRPAAIGLCCPLHLS